MENLQTKRKKGTKKAKKNWISEAKNKEFFTQIDAPPKYMSLSEVSEGGL